MCVSSMCQVLYWSHGPGAQTCLQELQINPGALATAETDNLPEFDPVIETEPPEGWLPGLGKEGGGSI